MLRYVNGDLPENVAQAETSQVPSAAQEATVSAQALAAPEEGELEFPYDVQFILQGQALDVPAVRAAIDKMGDSTLVVGDERALKVHVHVKDPGQPLSYAVGVGHISDVVVENMQEQMEAIIGHEHNAALDAQRLGVVAVAAGPGLSEIFRSLGAAAVVNGGQGHNPSTEEIYRAIEEAPMERLVVLPNNKNVILAAEAASELTQKEVAVVPTRTAPQGISAMLALNPDASLDETCQAMREAGSQVSSGEITVASRSVSMDGVDVVEGEIIGLVDGRVCSSGKSLPEVLSRTLEMMAVKDRELVSVYYGADVSQAQAEELVERIEALYPHVEVELLPGGQPYYMYILGAE
jgi:DAK2 domain fusion protein YloV